MYGNYDAETFSADAAARKRKLEEEEEERKNRGNYRCSKCNLPKKGHVCPHRVKYKKKDQVVVSTEPTNEIAIQVEMDPHMTLRALPLELQGLPESYAPIVTIPSVSMNYSEFSSPMFTGNYSQSSMSMTS